MSDVRGELKYTAEHEWVLIEGDEAVIGITDWAQGELGDVVEWIGASDHERGRALRDVLRLYDTIARSRDPVREPEAPRFPRFDVRAGRCAS